MLQDASVRIQAVGALTLRLYRQNMRCLCSWKKREYSICQRGGAGQSAFERRRGWHSVPPPDAYLRI